MNDKFELNPNLTVPSEEALSNSLLSDVQDMSYTIPNCPENSPCKFPEGIYNEVKGKIYISNMVYAAINVWTDHSLQSKGFVPIMPKRGDF